MNQSLSIEFDFDNEKLCKAVEKSVGLTSKRKKMRSSSNVKRAGKTLSVKIDAKDKTALRAAANSMLRWVSMVEDISTLINSFKIHTQ
ncbi:MAG: hypothetical protein J7K00_00285 [Candidatus Diapherotrites archaeon]|nr:hypothetical protein [Candidatus Diapherotrites archaeon]